jgi:fused signal recognition particle receptor
MTTVVIVVVIVVAVVAALLILGRSKSAQLQAPPSSAGRSLPPTAPKAKAEAPAQQAETVRTKPTPAPPRPSTPPEAPEQAKAAAPPPPPSARAKKDVAGLRKGLALARGGFIAKLSALFQGKKEIDPAILEQVEEVMISSDVGPKTTHAILERLRESLAKNELRDADAVWDALRAEALRILSIGGGAIRTAGKPTVVLMVGVNGVGKTTTIGKLATRYHAAGKKVVLGAGDTFRAAAVQQLEVWGKRVGAEVIRGKEGADPGAVAFDATTKAKEGGADLLFVDTAGRLHTKLPLMDEIKKVRKTIAKALDGAPHETLLVLDATTGQNALQQATLFKEALDLTGVVLTKLDGTAKGGIVLGVCDELGIPVRYVGLGERAEDLREFHADEFVEALFGRGEDDVAAA